MRACVHVCATSESEREKRKISSKRPYDCFIPAFDISVYMRDNTRTDLWIASIHTGSSHIVPLYTVFVECVKCIGIFISLLCTETANAKSCVKYFINENLCQHQHMHVREGERERAAVEPLKNSPQILSDHIWFEAHKLSFHFNIVKSMYLPLPVCVWVNKARTPSGVCDSTM